MVIVGILMVAFIILVKWNVLKISSLDAMELIFFMFVPIVETFSLIIDFTIHKSKTWEKLWWHGCIYCGQPIELQS